MRGSQSTCKLHVIVNFSHVQQISICCCIAGSVPPCAMTPVPFVDKCQDAIEGEIPEKKGVLLLPRMLSRVRK